MSALKASIEEDVAVLKSSVEALETLTEEFGVKVRLDWPSQSVTLNAGDGHWVPVATLVLGREPRVTIRTPANEYTTWVDALLYDATCRRPLIQAAGWKPTNEPGTPGWDTR